MNGLNAVFFIGVRQRHYHRGIDVESMIKSKASVWTLLSLATAAAVAVVLSACSQSSSDGADRLQQVKGPRHGHMCQPQRRARLWFSRRGRQQPGL